MGDANSTEVPSAVTEVSADFSPSTTTELKVTYCTSPSGRSLFGSYKSEVPLYTSKNSPTPAALITGTRPSDQAGCMICEAMAGARTSTTAAIIDILLAFRLKCPLHDSIAT